MSGDESRCIDEGPEVSETEERMYEIMGLLMSSQHAIPVVEYSALLGVAAHTMAAAYGMPVTRPNCSRIMRLMGEMLVPAIEAEVDGMIPGHGRGAGLLRGGIPWASELIDREQPAQAAACLRSLCAYADRILSGETAAPKKPKPRQKAQ